QKLQEIRVSRAQDRFGAAQERLSAQQKQEAERKKDAAEDLRERARAEKDPIRRYELERLAQIEERKAKLAEDKAIAGTLNTDRTGNKSLKADTKSRKERLETQFQRRGIFSAKVGKKLLRRRDRIERNVDDNRRRLAQVRDRIDENDVSMARVEDALAELDDPEPENEELQALYESAGPKRRKEARDAFDKFVTERESLLGERRSKLRAIDADLVQLEEIYEAVGAQLEDLRNFLVARMYWVRDSDPFGGETLRGALEDWGTFWGEVTGADIGRSLGAHRDKNPTGFYAMLVLFVGLVVVAAFLGYWMRRKADRWNYRGGPSLVLLQRIGSALLLSAIAPALLFAAGFMVRNLELPETFHDVVRTLLLGYAVVLFAGRFLWVLFKPGGIAATELRVPREITDQYMVATRRAFIAALVLYVPWLVFDGLQLDHLARLLYTALLVAMAIIAGRLVRRKGALVRHMTADSPFWRRLWWVIGPLIRIGLWALVVMDLLGYHLGASMLAENVLWTLGAALVLAGLYRLFTELSERAAYAIGIRQSQEEGVEEGMQLSSQVFEQLTRFVGVTMLVAVVLVVARLWGITELLERMLGKMQLATMDADKGIFLTVWNVLNALLLVIITHFLLRNLPGLAEAILFRKSKMDTGARYVVITFLRYGLFIVGYSAALIALHFNFTSVGWLLAAVSVGLGFGLQEIVANFVSGLILLVERPIRVGDVITVGQTGGTVEKINIRATLVTNWDRQQIIVPNKNFITQEVTNWTHNDDVTRRVIDVGIAYGSDVTRALQIFNGIVEDYPTVLKDPGPSVLFSSFGDSSLDFKLRFFTRIADGVSTQSDIRRIIHERLAEEGIEIPFPQRDLHVRSVDDEVAAVLGLERAGGKKADKPKPKERRPSSGPVAGVASTEIEGDDGESGDGDDGP
ncbi:MAG: mechanosensitive ion channel, partial [Planctomycetota bacterium]|nr:mechanosensitive ion channel [Planctomycetota bacterium]